MHTGIVWNYHKLAVVEEAKSLVCTVYELTNSLPRSETFGLAAQLNRSAISIGANIVEGASRASAKDFAHYLSIAIGSGSECEFLIEIAVSLGLVDAKQAEDVADHAQKVKRMTVQLRKAILARQ